MCIVLQILKGSFLFLQKRKRRERDDADAVSLCSFDFKVRKPAKQHRADLAQLIYRKAQIKRSCFLNYSLNEVSLSTTCLKTTSKSDYNIKKEKIPPPCHIYQQNQSHSAQDEITCLWQKSKPFNRKLEEFNLRKSFH